MRAAVTRIQHLGFGESELTFTTSQEVYSQGDNILAPLSLLIPTMDACSVILLIWVNKIK